MNLAPFRPRRSPETRRHCAANRPIGPGEIASHTPRLKGLMTLLLLGCFGSGTVVAAAPQGGNPVGDDELRAERFAIRDEERMRLDRLASQRETEGDADLASTIRSLLEPVPMPDGPFRFDPLPEIILPKPESEGQVSVVLDPEVTDVREENARRFAELAEQAFQANRLALADVCLRELLRRKPDDPEARRRLGYVPHAGGWATPHAVGRMKKGDVLHPVFGWVPNGWVVHLEDGLLPAPPRPGRSAIQWVPAEEADSARLGKIASGWQITTPHFKIQTSVPLDEGIDFGRRLEAFYDLFTSLCADVIGPERLQLAQLHRKPGLIAPAVAGRQHQVYYFGKKQEYVDYLAPRLRDASIEGTLGIYLDEVKISFFFKDEGGDLDVEATLYHEVSHQLLFELAGPTGYLRNPGDFWVFEGLGTYFETVQYQPDGSFRYGGKVGPRMEYARGVLVEDERLIPHRRFVGFDREAFRGTLEGDAQLHYAQANALTGMLIDRGEGRDREAFFRYVDDAYRGRLRGASSQTLADRIGITFEELDEQLLKFLASPFPGRETPSENPFEVNPFNEGTLPIRP